MEGTKYLGKVDDAQKHILKWERPRHLAISISKVWVSHDAAPHSIALWRMARARHANGYRLCGSDRLAGIVDADGYLIESNHDVEILRAGSYAWRLKQRILSDQATFLMKMGQMPWSGPWEIAPRRFIWGICQREQYQRMAHMTMENQLARADLAVGHDLRCWIHHQTLQLHWRRYKIGNHLRVVFLCLFEEIYI